MTASLYFAFAMLFAFQLYFETRREEVRTRRVGNRASFVGRSEVVFERHERKQNRKRIWEEQ